MAHEQVDVFINGGGIAGATLAFLLGRQGRRVVLVEHSDRGRMLSGADLLKPAGIRVIKSMGLLGDVVRIGGRMRDTLRVFHDREQLCVVDYKANGELGYFILIPCERLRNLVLEKVEQFPNVECLFNTKIDHVTMGADGGVDAITLDNGRIIAPAVMVGADGFASYTRKLLGITTERAVYPSQMFFGTTPLMRSVDECNRLYVDSRHGLAYFYPISRTEGRVVVSFPKEEMRELMNDNKAVPNDWARHLGRIIIESVTLTVGSHTSGPACFCYQCGEHTLLSELFRDGKSSPELRFCSRSCYECHQAGHLRT